MSLLLNGAGASAADPILTGLGFEFVIAAVTMDAASFTNAWIDANATFAGTNVVTTTPATSDVYYGTDMTSNVGGTFTTTSPHGLLAGDYMYISGGSASAITGGVYKVATVPTSTTFTLVNPVASAARTGISFEVAWRYQGVAGTAPSLTSAGGTQNFYKATLADSAGNATNQVDNNYIENAPSGTAYIAVDGRAVDGTATTRQATPSFSLLSGWANHGGVSHVQLTTSSVVGHTSASDFHFSDDTITEKTLSFATTNGLKLTAGDGVKYGAIQLKSLAGAAVVVTVPLQIALDTTAPTISLALAGR